MGLYDFSIVLLIYGQFTIFLFLFFFLRSMWRIRDCKINSRLRHHDHRSIVFHYASQFRIRLLRRFYTRSGLYVFADSVRLSSYIVSDKIVELYNWKMFKTSRVSLLKPSNQQSQQSLPPPVQLYIMSPPSQMFVNLYRKFIDNGHVLWFY